MRTVRRVFGGFADSLGLGGAPGGLPIARRPGTADRPDWLERRLPVGSCGPRRDRPGCPKVNSPGGWVAGRFR